MMGSTVLGLAAATEAEARAEGGARGLAWLRSCEASLAPALQPAAIESSQKPLLLGIPRAASRGSTWRLALEDRDPALPAAVSNLFLELLVGLHGPASSKNCSSSCCSAGLPAVFSRKYRRSSRSE